MKKEAIFIVFEGIDGSGTSTQASLLRDRLLRENRRAVLTSEPSDGPVGTMIRQAMKGRVNFTQSSQHFDRQMAYLFAADRYDHLYNDVDGVKKFINQGCTVISTRYFFSSYAYHSVTEEDLRIVKSLNSHFPAPDLVVYLRNPVTRSIERMSNRSHKDIYENAEKLALVSDNYERIFGEYAGELLVMDAQDEIMSLHNHIYEHVRGML